MSTNPIVPLLSDLAPDGFAYTGQYMVEFDADSLWYETSLTIAALALQRGFKTEYHVFDHFPSEALRALSDLGVDAKRFEAEGLLSIWDSYTETTEFEKAKTTGIGWETAGERPLDIVRGAESWVERTKKGYPPGEMRWLHLDDNTGIFLQYNDEETVVDRWRTAILPAVRARECPHFLAFPKGIASEAFYTKFEALCDGIIDLKTEEVEGRVERFLRIRRLKGKVFDSQWHRLEVQADGAVRFATLPLSGPARRLAAIMFTDLVGFTALGQQNEALSLELLEDQRALLRPIFQRHGGREVKTIGDGFLVEFPNALESVRCAYEIQRSSREVNLSRPSERRVFLRVGVHLGDVVDTHGDISGDAVNIASRIEPLAEPGGVCITRQVYDQVQNKFERPLTSLGAKPLKNVHSPLEVFKVVMPWTGGDEAGSSEVDRSRIAILPLANFSPDPGDAYFADGLTEELISTLSGIRTLRVISRTSVSRYKGTDKSIAQIGAELGVTSILEGSVRKAGDRVRITVQMIDVPTDEHRWSQTFDHNFDDVFKLQSEIARHVAEILKVEIRPSESERLRLRSTVRPDSYLAYLRGRAGLQGRAREPLRNARKEFEAAIQLDPTNARAYSGLADVTELLWSYHHEGSGSREAVIELIRKALELDPNLSEAHASLGWLHRKKLEYSEAEKELRLAISLNPSYHTAHHWYALLLEDEGDVDRALEQLELASQLDPFSLITIFGQAQLLTWLNRLEEAEAKLQRLADVEGMGAFYHSLRADIYWQKGDISEAAKEIDQCARFMEQPDDRLWNQAVKSAVLGETRQAREILEQLSAKYAEDPSESWSLARLCSLLKDSDGFFRWVRKAAAGQQFEARFWRLDPMFEEMRRDARFDELLKRLNLA